MALLDSMTTFATNDPSQTIFESFYTVKPSIPPVGCFGVRLECEKPRRFNLGSKNTVGVFLAYSNFDGVYGAVLMTGKNTLLVGKQQMAFDYKYFPLKHSGKTNPHLKTLYTVMYYYSTTISIYYKIPAEQIQQIVMIIKILP